VIGARLAAPRRAALLTSLVLAAAALRAALLPWGDALSTAVFAACLLGITVAGGALSSDAARWGRGRAIVSGTAVGAVLIAPLISGGITGRPLGAFWSWALIAAVVATLEETTIRGVLYQHWREEAGTMAAIVLGAAVFALIHLSRYGLSAMPLDFSVGLVLGGLRAIAGRVLPCAVAHTLGDWGAWFWA
jgi:membrane protease YdiL (CAAX protease family)